MNRKWIYIGTLVGFFLTWGVFGAEAGAAPNEPRSQATLPPVGSTAVLPGAPDSAGIAVTDRPEPVWTEVVVFYGLIGLTTLFLMLALLILANRMTTPSPYTQPGTLPSKTTDKD